jgi:hypothetical protein
MLGTDDDWKSPQDFPPAVFEWWKGQKQILFHNRAVRCFADIMPVAIACQRLLDVEVLSHANPQEKTTLWYTLLQCMIRQRQHLHLSSGKANLFDKNEDYAQLAHVRFLGEEVPRICRECRTTASTEKHPHYVVHEQGVMIAIRGYCKPCQMTSTGTKKPRSTLIIPADGRVYVTYSKSRIRSYTAIKNGYRIDRALRKSDADPRFNQQVESTCLWCQHRTLLSDGTSVFVDSKPRWTIGIKRPLYVERQPQCLTCPPSKMARFVPLDPSIPSITSRVLGDTLDDVVDVDPAILPMFLDEIQPASRVPRCDKQRNRKRKRLEIQDNTLPKPKASRTEPFPQPLPCPVKGCSSKAQYSYSSSLRHHIKERHQGEIGL